MRIILLGSNGQLGTDIRSANESLDQPHRLVALTRADFDVTDRTKLQSELLSQQFDVLINCTGYHRTDEAEGNAQLAFDVNAHAVEAMAELCAQSNARFFHVSTDFVFDGSGRETPYREEDATSPINVYGASKAKGERLALGAHDLTNVLRVASLFGIAGASAKAHGNFVDMMIAKARRGETLEVVSDHRMSPTATAEVARMVFELIDSSAEPGIYHAVNSSSASWYELAKEVVARAGIDAIVKPIKSSEFKTRTRRPAYSVLDNTKIAAIAGPIPDWSDSLDAYLRAKQYID